MSDGKQRAVVLLSGGMDSCVCAGLAARDYEPFALHVMYGQRTEARERLAFEGICERLGIARRMVIRNEALRQIGGSALTDASIAVPEARESPVASRHSPETQGPSTRSPNPGSLARDDTHEAGGDRSPNPDSLTRDDNHEAGADHAITRSPDDPMTRSPDHPIPITYVPFRNAHFLSAAVSWAEVLGAEKILIGAVEQDSSGYPDCRPAYYQAFNQVIRAGTREGNIEIVTPLIGMRKAEIVRLGLELGAPFDLTWSCYSREEEACGVCESCVLRLRAFAAAGARDPIPYAAGVGHAGIHG